MIIFVQHINTGLCASFAAPGGYHHIPSSYHYSDQPSSRDPRSLYPGPSPGYEKTFVGSRRISEPYSVHKHKLRERDDYLQDSGGYTMDSAESDYYEREMQVCTYAENTVFSARSLTKMS